LIFHTPSYGWNVETISQVLAPLLRGLSAKQTGGVGLLGSDNPSASPCGGPPPFTREALRVHSSDAEGTRMCNDNYRSVHAVSAGSLHKLKYGFLWKIHLVISCEAGYYGSVKWLSVGRNRPAFCATILLYIMYTV